LQQFIAKCSLENSVGLLQYLTEIGMSVINPDFAKGYPVTELRNNELNKY
jgi:hypothetical protein